MTRATTTPSIPSRRAAGIGSVLGFVALVTLARLAYLYLLCPYNLIEDEAHYWEWSRRLDWSYYTKGPGIAWAIRAATELIGTSEAAIRTVSVIASGIATLAVGALAGFAASGRSDVSEPGVDPDGSGRGFDGRAALFGAAVFSLVPAFQLTALLATIDGAYAACWSVACLAALWALQRRSLAAWPLLGGAIGVGFLFKYTILLLLPGLTLYLVVCRRHLALARGWPLGALGGLLVMLVAMTPVLWWNHAHQWPTLAHLLGHLGLAGGDMPVGQSRRAYDPRWTLEFIGTQLAIVGPMLGLAVIGATKLIGARAESPSPSQAGRQFLVCCAAPILAFYLAVSFFARPEGNWALGAYVTLAALAGWCVSDREGDRRVRVLCRITLAYGLICGLGMLRADLLTRVMPDGRPGRLGSLTGPALMGEDAARRAAELRSQSGLEPFFIVQHYGRASLLAFYIPGNPNVRCSSSRMGGRTTQYDYWPDTSLDGPSLLGRPAVCAGATLEQWQAVFDRVEPIGKLAGEHKKDREAFLGYGYKGWSRDAESK